jgi:hypothetical protein
VPTVPELLRSCLVSGDFTPLRELHTPDARLEAWLVSNTIDQTGPGAVVDAFRSWHTSPATLAHWEVLTYELGYSLEYERKPSDGGPPSRFWHQIFIRDDLITGHAIWEDRAQHVDMSGSRSRTSRRDRVRRRAGPRSGRIVGGSGRTIPHA